MKINDYLSRFYIVTYLRMRTNLPSRTTVWRPEGYISIIGLSLRSTSTIADARLLPLEDSTWQT